MEPPKRYYSIHEERNEILQKFYDGKSQSGSESESEENPIEVRKRVASFDQSEYNDMFATYRRGEETPAPRSQMSLLQNSKTSESRPIVSGPSLDWSKFLGKEQNPFEVDSEYEYEPEPE